MQRGLRHPGEQKKKKDTKREMNKRWEHTIEKSIQQVNTSEKMSEAKSVSHALQTGGK